MNKKYVPAFLLIMLLTVISSANAEIYRYQDKDGKWRFSDAAPPEGTKGDVINIKGSDSQAVEEATGEDLAAYLTKKINPNSEIEKATLAVVKIVTPYGTGSGFFINNSGYLITNKHVVRPTSSEVGKTIEDDLKRDNDAFQQYKSGLEERSRQLSDYKNEIDDYKKKMDAARESDKPKMQKEYDYHSDRYQKMNAEYFQYKKEYDKAREGFEAKKRAISEGEAASHFKIIFKNDLTKQARLVELGKKEDLALLRIEGNYKTPFLPVADLQATSQGDEVFAVGSPLGLEDYVTKGTITHFGKDRIITDTKILPGNSGGPLITPAGKALGINTAVMRADNKLGSELFGLVIPIDAAREEFTKYWQPGTLP